MEDDPKQLRQAAKKFALEALTKMQNNRLYALTPQSEIVLSALARAMFEIRKAEGRHDKEPNPWREFASVVEALSKAGCNVLQQRVTDPKPLPQVWRNPLNNEPLPPPKGVGERSLLQKLDPELLQMFDALEKEPYQTVHRLREAEASRQAMAKIEYSEITHQANPFRRGDQTEMARLVKHDPLLASFCQQEAKDVELNLFGAQRDLTARGKLLRDPAAAAIVELGEKIHEQWRMEDKAQAAEQMTAAEAKLKELAASETAVPPRMVGRARVGIE